MKSTLRQFLITTASIMAGSAFLATMRDFAPNVGWPVVAAGSAIVLFGIVYMLGVPNEEG